MNGCLSHDKVMCQSNRGKKQLALVENQSKEVSPGLPYYTSICTDIKLQVREENIPFPCCEEVIFNLLQYNWKHSATRKSRRICFWPQQSGTTIVYHKDLNASDLISRETDTIMEVATLGTHQVMPSWIHRLCRNTYTMYCRWLRHQWQPQNFDNWPPYSLKYATDGVITDPHTQVSLPQTLAV